MANIIKIKHGAAAPTVANLNDFELGYSINEQKLYIKEVKNGAATLRSFSADTDTPSFTKVDIGGDQYWKNGAYGIDLNDSDIIGVNGLWFEDAVSSAGEGIHFYRSSTTWDRLYSRDGTLCYAVNVATNTYPGTEYQVFHSGLTIPVANGGTGLTAGPSMKVNLGSTSAASVFSASPQPGVTGTLPVANGGTGLSTITSGSFLVGNGTGKIALKTASEVLSTIGAAPSSHDHSASNITGGTLPVKRGGTGLSTITAGSFLVGNGTGAISQRTASEVLSIIGAAPSSHNHSVDDIITSTGQSIKYTDGTVTLTSNAKETSSGAEPILRYFPYLGLAFVSMSFNLNTSLSGNSLVVVANSSLKSYRLTPLVCYSSGASGSTQYKYDFTGSINSSGEIRLTNSGGACNTNPTTYIFGFFPCNGI